MKKIMAALCSAALLFFACSKNDPLTQITPTVPYPYDDSTGTFSWYINGDKSNKMLTVIYGGHAQEFPDSILTVKVFEMEINQVVLDDGSIRIDSIVGPLASEFPDVLHHSYNVNATLLDKGYQPDIYFWTFLYNEYDRQITVPEFRDFSVLRPLE